jgi:hypothetical protein
MPQTLALAFFAALAVVLGHLVYQMAAPLMVRKQTLTDHAAIGYARIQPPRRYIKLLGIYEIGLIAWSQSSSLMHASGLSSALKVFTP